MFVTTQTRVASYTDTNDRQHRAQKTFQKSNDSKRQNHQADDSCYADVLETHERIIVSLLEVLVNV
ncbi:MAG: hypothetical protein ACPG32_16125 [Akkermansiaceae bacterium]